jgi:hypothetical protein
MTMLELNDLLGKAGVDPASTLVMRHRPTEPALRRVLPWLAQERPEVFNAYQSQHGPRTEAALLKARHLASFIGHETGQALFVGLYAVRGGTPVTPEAFWEMPANRMLHGYGTRGPAEDQQPIWFDLALTPLIGEFKGRLVVRWPGIERAWWRWAARNTIPVHAILPDSALVPAMPDWHSLVLSWQELQALPATWRAALAQWRGVYLIFDERDGGRYVGSAAGAENLLGRWLDYAATGHGQNKLLVGRDPSTFRFSILERTSPDLDPALVVEVESRWKTRLHTHVPHGLNDN